MDFVPATNSAASRLTAARRVVIKIGSALLVDGSNGQLKEKWLEDFCADIARLKDSGKDVVIVSSGAIALGRAALRNSPAELTLEKAQSAAAIGQIRLAKAFSEHLSRLNLTAAQILVTLDDTTDRRRYLNMQATLSALLEDQIVPIVNENDTVATDEIRYGDNDRLAARMASTIGADLLILLSDIDGLYTANPTKDDRASHIPLVEDITPQIEAMAGDAASSLSRGGMRTKIMAGQIATRSGCAMIIASGLEPSPVQRIQANCRATLFLAKDTPVQARKNWIGGMKPKGRILIDAGAASALEKGHSLLPVGICKIEGEFDRGDAIEVLSQTQQRLGQGLVQYSASDARKIAGLKSQHVAQALGYPARSSLIHRDDLVLHLTRTSSETTI